MSLAFASSLLKGALRSPFALHYRSNVPLRIQPRKPILNIRSFSDSASTTTTTPIIIPTTRTPIKNASASNKSKKPNKRNGNRNQKSETKTTPISYFTASDPKNDPYNKLTIPEDWSLDKLPRNPLQAFRYHLAARNVTSAELLFKQMLEHDLNLKKKKDSGQPLSGLDKPLLGEEEFLALMRLCGRKRRGVNVEYLFKTMRDELKIPLSTQAWSVYITQIGSLGKDDIVKEAFQRIIEGKESIEPDVKIFTAMISYCAQNHKIDVQSAHQYLDQMISRGIEPTLVTYTSLIVLHSRAKDYEMTIHYLKVLKEKGLKTTPNIHLSLLNSFASVGDVEGMETFESYLLSEGLKMTLALNNVLISGYSIARHFKKAWYIYTQRMTNINEQTIMALLVGIRMSRKPYHLAALIEELKAMPNANWSALNHRIIVAWAASGRITKALEMLDNEKQSRPVDMAYHFLASIPMSNIRYAKLVSRYRNLYDRLKVVYESEERKYMNTDEESQFYSIILDPTFRKIVEEKEKLHISYTPVEKVPVPTSHKFVNAEYITKTPSSDMRGEGGKRWDRYKDVSSEESLD